MTITQNARSVELDRELLAHILAPITTSRRKLHRGRVLDAWSALAHVEPTDVALAEHLDAALTVPERRVVALRVTRMLPRALAARGLSLSAAELDELEAAASAKASELTLAFHEEMICEPAALAMAHTPPARVDAVREHLDGCRGCRAEFVARVAHVMRHAGSLVEPDRPTPVP